MLASAVGPVASGMIFDATGRYGGALALWLVAMGSAAIIAWWMRAAEEYVIP